MQNDTRQVVERICGGQDQMMGKLDKILELMVISTGVQREDLRSMLPAVCSSGSPAVPEVVWVCQLRAPAMHCGAGDFRGDRTGRKESAPVDG
jgi:hypothetical protein